MSCPDCLQWAQLLGPEPGAGSVPALTLAQQACPPFDAILTRSRRLSALALAAPPSLPTSALVRCGASGCGSLGGMGGHYDYRLALASADMYVQGMSDYGHFRACLMTDVSNGMTPRQVAEILIHEADRFPQITQSEIEALLRRGDSWHLEPELA